MNTDWPACRYGSLSPAPDTFRICNVHRDWTHSASTCGRTERIEVSTAYRHVGTSRREFSCDRRADSRTATGYQDVKSCQIIEFHLFNHFVASQDPLGSVVPVSLLQTRIACAASQMLFRLSYSYKGCPFGKRFLASLSLRGGLHLCICRLQD